MVGGPLDARFNKYKRDHGISVNGGNLMNTPSKEHVHVSHGHHESELGDKYRSEAWKKMSLAEQKV